MKSKELENAELFRKIQESRVRKNCVNILVTCTVYNISGCSTRNLLKL